jgi:hypothetical protein
MGMLNQPQLWELLVLILNQNPGTKKKCALIDKNNKRILKILIEAAIAG